MAKFPEPPPPDVLRGVDPDEAPLPRGTLLWRIYFRGGPNPTSWNAFRRFGPTGSRFDHHVPPPAPQDRAILYVADRVATCIAEFFQDTHTIDSSRREPWLTGFRLTRDVALLSLRGNWPTRAGASMALSTGARARARRWSSAIYEAFPGIEGLLYCSSIDANERVAALYERAETALPGAPDFNKPLSDPDLWGALEQAARQFGYALVGP